MKKLEDFFPVLASLILSLPGLFFLAHFPQSPDGAELFSTALAGGVLHPSGLPLQAWLDRFFILLFPATPALGLSLLSWMAEGVAITFLIQSLRKLETSWFAALSAAVAYAFFMQMASLSVQPEKYSLIAMLSLTLTFVVIRALRRAGGPTSGDRYLTAFVFALALAQHTGLALLFPIVLAPFVGVRRPLASRTAFFALLIFLAVTTGAYLSLFWMRAPRPWPDWGNLQSLNDLWNHVIRADFKNGLVNLDLHTATTSIRASSFLFLSLKQWTILNFALPLGIFALVKKRPQLGFALGATVSLMIFGLWWTELPSPDDPLTLGYGLRYPCVVLPFLALLLGCGLQWLEERGRIIAIGSKILASAALCFVVARGFLLLQKTDSNVIEVYRGEVAKELPSDAIFVSTNEIDLFYGIPCTKGICFPIKDLFASTWYRERTAPAMDARLTELIRPFYGKTWSYTAFLVAAVQKGYTLASTSGNLFIQVPEFQGHIEQRGLVWTVTPSVTPLYSQAILSSADRLCHSISTVNFAVPKEGDYFLHEILRNFRYVFLSATDALQRPAVCEALNAIF